MRRSARRSRIFLPLDRGNTPRPNDCIPKAIGRSMKASVSTLAIAMLLGGCALKVSESVTFAETPSAADTAGVSATPADADAFIARAEQELSEFTVLQARADWVNATYITDDTDALAAHFGAQATEMAVRFASEAARYQAVEGLGSDTKR